MFFLATTIFFALLYLRALAVNDRLRRELRDPSERAWRAFERRHPSIAP